MFQFSYNKPLETKLLNQSSYKISLKNIINIYLTLTTSMFFLVDLYLYFLIFQFNIYNKYIF